MISLPNTKLNISPLCLGTGNYGTGIDEATAFALLDKYVELGGNVLDTANVYGKWGAEKTNTSEQIIGRWLKTNNNRKDIVLCSKGCHYDMETPDIPRLSPQAFKDDLKESMDTLGVDNLDLFYLHRDDPTVPEHVVVDMLHDAMGNGLVHHVGVSNWTAERIQAAETYAHKEYGYNQHENRRFSQKRMQSEGQHSFFLTADQMMWNLAVPNKDEPAGPATLAMNDKLFAYHQHTKTAVFAYSSQAKGYFSKALRDDFDSNPGYDWVKADFQNAETNRRVELVRQIAEETGADGTQIALAWLMDQPFITIPVIGCRTVEQLESSFGALNQELSEIVAEKLKI